MWGPQIILLVEILMFLVHAKFQNHTTTPSGSKAIRPEIQEAMRRGEINSGGYENNILPSIMTTSLARCPTHSAWTKNA